MEYVIQKQNVHIIYLSMTTKEAVALYTIEKTDKLGVGRHEH